MLKLKTMYLKLFFLLIFFLVSCTHECIDPGDDFDTVTGYATVFPINTNIFDAQSQIKIGTTDKEAQALWHPAMKMESGSRKDFIVTAGINVKIFTSGSVSMKGLNETITVTTDKTTSDDGQFDFINPKLIPHAFVNGEEIKIGIGEALGGPPRISKIYPANNKLTSTVSFNIQNGIGLVVELIDAPNGLIPKEMTNPENWQCSTGISGQSDKAYTAHVDCGGVANILTSVLGSVTGINEIKNACGDKNSGLEDVYKDAPIMSNVNDSICSPSDKECGLDYTCSNPWSDLDIYFDVGTQDDEGNAACYGFSRYGMYAGFDRVAAKTKMPIWTMLTYTRDFYKEDTLGVLSDIAAMVIPSVESKGEIEATRTDALLHYPNFARCTANWKKENWMNINEETREFLYNEPLSGFFLNSSDCKSTSSLYGMNTNAQLFGGLVKYAIAPQKSIPKDAFLIESSSCSNLEFIANYDEQIITIKSILNDHRHASGICPFTMKLNNQSKYTAEIDYDKLKDLPKYKQNTPAKPFKKIIKKGDRVTIESDPNMLFISSQGLDGMTFRKECGIGTMFRVSPVPKLACVSGYHQACSNYFAQNIILKETQQSYPSLPQTKVYNTSEYNQLLTKYCPLVYNNKQIGICLKNVRSNNGDLIGANLLRYDSPDGYVNTFTTIPIMNSSNLEWSTGYNVLEDKCGICVEKKYIESVSGENVIKDLESSLLYAKGNKITSSEECANQHDMKWLTRYTNKDKQKVSFSFYSNQIKGFCMDTYYQTKHESQGSTEEGVKGCIREYRNNNPYSTQTQFENTTRVSKTATDYFSQYTGKKAWSAQGDSNVYIHIDKNGKETLYEKDECLKAAIKARYTEYCAFHEDPAWCKTNIDQIIQAQSIYKGYEHCINTRLFSSHGTKGGSDDGDKFYSSSIDRINQLVNKLPHESIFHTKFGQNPAYYDMHTIDHSINSCFFDNYRREQLFMHNNNLLNKYYNPKDHICNTTDIKLCLHSTGNTQYISSNFYISFNSAKEAYGMKCNLYTQNSPSWHQCMKSTCDNILIDIQNMEKGVPVPVVNLYYNVKTCDDFLHLRHKYGYMYLSEHREEFLKYAKGINPLYSDEYRDMKFSFQSLFKMSEPKTENPNILGEVFETRKYKFNITDGKKKMLMFYIAGETPTDKEHLDTHRNFQQNTNRGYTINVFNGENLYAGKGMYAYIQAINPDTFELDPNEAPGVKFANMNLADVIKRPDVYNLDQIKSNNNTGNQTNYIKFKPRISGKLWFIVPDVPEGSEDPYRDGQYLITEDSKPVNQTRGNIKYYNKGAYKVSLKTKDVGGGSIISMSILSYFIISPIKYFMFGPVGDDGQRDWESGFIYQITTAVTKNAYFQLLFYVGFILYLLTYGYNLINGDEKVMDLKEASKQMLNIGFIFALVSPNSWNLYQTYCVELFINIADGMSKIALGSLGDSIQNNPGIAEYVANNGALGTVGDFFSETLYNSIIRNVGNGSMPSFSLPDADNAVFQAADNILKIIINPNTFIKVLALLFDSFTGFFVAIGLVLSWIIVILVIMKGVVMYIATVLGISFYACLGPFFILSRIHPKTAGAFDTWWKTMISFVIEQSMLYITIALFSNLYYEMMKNMLNFGVCMEPVLIIPIINLTLMSWWTVQGTVPNQLKNYMPEYKNAEFSDNISVLQVFFLFVLSLCMIKIFALMSKLSGSKALDIAGPLGNFAKGIDQMIQNPGAIVKQLKEQAAQKKNDKKK